jgi:hypothetical protein
MQAFLNVVKSRELRERERERERERGLVAKLELGVHLSWQKPRLLELN